MKRKQINNGACVAVLEAVKTLNKPVTIAEVAGVSPFAPDQCRFALAYLARKGKIKRVEYGVYAPNHLKIGRNRSRKPVELPKKKPQPKLPNWQFSIVLGFAGALLFFALVISIMLTMGVGL